MLMRVGLSIVEATSEVGESVVGILAVVKVGAVVNLALPIGVTKAFTVPAGRAATATEAAKSLFRLEWMESFMFGGCVFNSSVLFWRKV